MKHAILLLQALGMTVHAAEQSKPIIINDLMTTTADIVGLLPEYLERTQD